MSIHLTSNIWPEVAAGVFGIILCLNLHFKYADAAEANVFYRHLAYAVTAATVVDVFSVIMHGVTHPVPSEVFLLNTTLFYIATVVAAYCLLRYIVMRAQRQNRRYFRLQKYILYADILLLISNLVTRFFYDYDETGRIIYGPFHLAVAYGVAFYFLLSACVMQGVHKGLYTLVQRVVLRSAGVSLLVAFVIQFFFLRELMFSYAVGILSVYLVFFAVELPVYRRLEETTRQLKQTEEEAFLAASRAQAASRAKTNFLANTSHEIRTPMNAIMGMNEMILRATNDEQIAQAAGQIRGAGLSLLQIINDVLDYARIESGKMQRIDGRFCLSDILMEVVHLWQPQIEERGISFTVEIEEDVTDERYGDQDKLRQITANLISNAYKYTEKGSIRLHVGRKEPEEELLLVQVEDTGSGIREEEIESIFQLFTRASLEENRDKQGAGLGLKIADELSKIMGGLIRVSSVYGEGSCFTLEVPLQQGEGEEKARAAFLRKQQEYLERQTRAPFTARDKTVLVVDDTVVNLTVARGMLSPFGVRVDAAMNGKEALSLAKLHAYDLVFMDHRMPEMDGIETLRRLRRIKGYESGKTAVVALTSNVDETSRSFYLSQGFDDYLPKPMRQNEVEDMLKKHLGEGA